MIVGCLNCGGGLENFVGKEGEPKSDNASSKTPLNSSSTSAKENAVKLKLFGKLTRETFEWHPAALLCKRFDVPDPYPKVRSPCCISESLSLFIFHVDWSIHT